MTPLENGAMKMTDAEAAAAAFMTASRALLGISLRSVAAAPVPLTVPQHRLLVLVSSDGPRRVGTLADDLGVNQSNASRLVARLAEQGLVQRVADPADGRVSVVEATAAGRRVLDAVSEHRLRELRAVVAGMPPASWRPAVEVLHAFNAAAHEAEAGAVSTDAEEAR
jgi:DNA-binding MarR family transcriptional regulator